MPKSTDLDKYSPLYKGYFRIFALEGSFAFPPGDRASAKTIIHDLNGYLKALPLRIMRIEKELVVLRADGRDLHLIERRESYLKELRGNVRDAENSQRVLRQNSEGKWRVVIQDRFDNNKAAIEGTLAMKQLIKGDPDTYIKDSLIRSQYYEFFMELGYDPDTGKRINAPDEANSP